MPLKALRRQVWVIVYSRGLCFLTTDWGFENSEVVGYIWHSSDCEARHCSAGLSLLVTRALIAGLVCLRHMFHSRLIALFGALRCVCPMHCNEWNSGCAVCAVCCLFRAEQTGLWAVTLCALISLMCRRRWATARCSSHDLTIAHVNSPSRSLYAIARPSVCSLSSVCSVRAQNSGD